MQVPQNASAVIRIGGGAPVLYVGCKSIACVELFLQNRANLSNRSNPDQRQLAVKAAKNVKGMRLSLAKDRHLLQPKRRVMPCVLEQRPLS